CSSGSCQSCGGQVCGSGTTCCTGTNSVGDSASGLGAQCTSTNSSNFTGTTPTCNTGTHKWVCHASSSGSGTYWHSASASGLACGTCLSCAGTVCGGTQCCGGATPTCSGGTCQCTASSCGSGQVCSGGACVSCGAGTTACGGTACCAAGQVCSGGACVGCAGT